MHRFEIGHVLRTIAGLLALKGESVFKVRAYEKAALIIEHGNFDVELLAREGKLTQIPGIGRNLAPKIHELVTRGTCSYLEKLTQEVPPGLLDVMNVPGIGLSTAKVLYDTLGITDLKSLENALNAGLIRKVPGLGPRREALIRHGLTEVMKLSGRVLFGQALPVARHILEVIESAGIYGTIVGELARASETVPSLEILVKARDHRDLLEKVKGKHLGHLTAYMFREGAWVREIQAFVFPSNLGVPVRIYVAPEDLFGLRQLWLTGPQAFLDWLKQLAEGKGYVLTENGLTRAGKPTKVPMEMHIFDMLDISFIPPELRNSPEYWQMSLEKVGIEPIKVSDIKGDLHIHTTWSDGIDTIERIVQKALELGYSYIAISDHATRIKVINGLDPNKIQAQKKEIEEVAARYPRIRILQGVEVDILKDGSLALPDEVLSKLDIVIASIHHGLEAEGRTVVDRLIKAAANPHVDIIGHPTGRLIGRRPGNRNGLEELFRTAAANNTALEINASPDRLDLPADLAAAAHRFGVKLAVNTDAHSTSGMDDMAAGVAASPRRAGLTPECVLNAQDLEKWFPLKPGDVR